MVKANELSCDQKLKIFNNAIQSVEMTYRHDLQTINLTLNKEIQECAKIQSNNLQSACIQLANEQFNLKQLKATQTKDQLIYRYKESLLSECQ